MLPSALKEELAGVINAGLFHNVSSVITRVGDSQTAERARAPFRSVLHQCKTLCVDTEASLPTNMWQRVGAFVDQRTWVEGRRAWRERREGWMGGLRRGWRPRREPKREREARAPRGQVRFLSFLTSFMGLRNKFASEVRAECTFQKRARSFVSLKPENKPVVLPLFSRS